jgi:hypothetical protein
VFLSPHRHFPLLLKIIIGWIKKSRQCIWIEKYTNTDYLLDMEYNKKVVTPYINIVIPTIRAIRDHRNALSPYSENTMKTQDSIPVINMATLDPFNSISNAFFSIITFPQIFENIHIRVLTFMGGYE